MKRILCIGDSNTWGYDPRSYLGSRYEKGVPWPDRLSSPDREILNAGLCGRTIPRRRDEPDMEALLSRTAPLDAVILMLGTNDLLEGASAREVGERMGLFLPVLRERAACPVLLVAPPPLRPGAWVESGALVRESEQLAEEYRALAVRLSLPFADGGEWGVELCFDGVHFTPEGHAAFAGGLAPVLSDLLEKSKKNL